jgi:DNA-binding CsgD family transcriptional regulator
LTASTAKALLGRHVNERRRLVAAKHLNPRETQTLDLLALYLENKEIADRLKVSVPVAEKILRNVYRKLGVHHRSEAVVLWNRCGQ